MSKKPRRFNKGLVWFSVCLAFLFSVSFAMPVLAVGASLYLSPSVGVYTVGNTFLVQVKVNSGGVAINAADVVLVFDPDKLGVESVSKTDSVFSLWVQDPAFSNSLGTIEFAGGKPSPGFTGASGTIINITFKARTSGAANLTFAAGSVLADDGKGTNILTNMGAGSYTLNSRETAIIPIAPPEEEEKEEEEKYVPPVTPSVRVPSAPVVFSITHPEENQWYSKNNPEFSWQLPQGVTQVSYVIDQVSLTNPDFVAASLVSKAAFSNVKDGVWYFHINFRNTAGWGELTHRKVLIDTQSPKSFEITVDNEGDSTNPTPVLYFDTKDDLSGLDHYEVQIDDQEPITNIKAGPYRVLPQPSGEHSVEVRAFDRAGNFISASTGFEVSPIEGVEITKIPRSIRMEDTLKIAGKAFPEITVRIYLQSIGKEPILEKVKADLEGKFVLTYDRALARGDYLIWAQAEDERGALSYPTQKYALEVGLPPFLRFGKIAVDYLTTMITLIILIVGAIAIIFYIWYRISLWRKRARKETKEVEESVARSFRGLRTEIEEQIALLDKKPGLTKGEKETRDKLREALDIAEESISKEIKDVEKELE